MKNKIIFSFLFLTTLTVINACDYAIAELKNNDDTIPIIFLLNLPKNHKFQIFILAIPSPDKNELSEEDRLRELATSTREWQLYEQYKEMKIDDYLTLFEKECKKSSCNQSDACKLLDAFAEYKKSFKEQFAKIEKDAHNTNEYNTFENFKQNIKPEIIR